MTATRIDSEVDLSRAGAQSGYLRVPHSTHRSAYGWLPVPITVLRNGAGPTVLMLGGVHGDEYEGQIALSTLAHTLTAEEIAGTLILLPVTNAPAAAVGQRVSPIDAGNLNRQFPGDAHGTPTQMIAHYIEEVLLPGCDVLVDLHSGGSSLFYPPTLLRGRRRDEGQAARLRHLQTAFDLPYAWEFTSGGGRASTAPTAMGAANRKGVLPVMAELGGAGTVSRDVLAITNRGLRRVLHALGMLPGYAPDAARGTRVLHAQGCVYAYEAGVFEPLRDIAEPVAKGAEVGRIHAVDTPGRAPVPVMSPHEGIVLAKRTLAQVQRGDAVFQIARDAAPPG